MNKLICLCCFLFLTTALAAQKDGPQVNWYTWSGAIEAMEKDEKPKKIFVDLYTNWCGYCKKMDRETFTDPLVVAYLNANFYPVKFDAEGKESLSYADHTFNYEPNRGRNGTHMLAFALLDGKMQFPSLVYLDEEQKRIAISPGYKPADSFLDELKFIAENHYKKGDYNAYKTRAKP